MVTMMALSTRIKVLEGELALCRAVVGKGVSSAALSNKDIPKSKEFVGTRFAYDVDNFLWRIKTTSVPNASWMMRLSFSQNLPRKKLGQSCKG
ncbi:hypothetical protein Gohar_022253 [Gossypium harknessii]|uniref:Uncharacterized protein n=1 Tax=Gossypium harknessii TaxID=34285 RepID=A0A7J9IGR8_9ROSI|nr:hypothetical protein [Gossypium harknessii]